MQRRVYWKGHGVKDIFEGRIFKVMTWHKDMNQGCGSGGRVLRLDYGSFYLRMYDVRMLYEHMCPYVIRRLHYVILLFRILPVCKVFCYLLTLRRYCIRLQEVVCVFYRIMRGREIQREKGERGDGRQRWEGERRREREWCFEFAVFHRKCSLITWV